MKWPQSISAAVASICLAVVVVFMIQCVQVEKQKGRCEVWENDRDSAWGDQHGIMECSGDACANCGKPSPTPTVTP